MTTPNPGLYPDIATVVKQAVVELAALQVAVGQSSTIPQSQVTGLVTSLATLTASIATNTTDIAARGLKMTTTAVKTANYTAAANETVPCDPSGGSFTVTLPNAPASGTRVTVKNDQVAKNIGVTIACAGSDVINRSGGATSATLYRVNASYTFTYDSGVWLITSADGGTVPDMPEQFTAGDFVVLAGQGSVPGTQVQTNNRLVMTPFKVSNPLSISQLSISVTAAGNAGSTAKLGIYAHDPVYGQPGALLADCGSVSTAAIAVVTTTALGTALKLNPGWYWYGTLVQSAATTAPTLATSVTNALEMGCFIKPTTIAAALSSAAVGYFSGGQTGALPNPFPGGAGVSQLTVQPARVCATLA